MKVIYIAGPFRALNADGSMNHWEQEQNIRRAEALALRVWQAGGAALCPHLNTRNFQGAASDHVWLDGDLAMLAKCDAVLMTPDWERSVGARSEHALATERGMPVFYQLGTLTAWLRESVCTCGQV